MSISYTWSFPQLDVAKSEDGLTDVVKTIHWRLTAADGDISTAAYGTVGLDAADPTKFKPFATITEDWCISAVSEKLDVTEIKDTLANQIELLKNPPIVPMVPPFAAIK